MQLLKLRYYQVKRDLGIWAILIAGGIFYFCLEFASDTDRNSYILIGIVLIAMYTYHANRNDRNFLSHYLKRPLLQVLVNYNFSIVPASLALIINHYPLNAFGLHLLVSCIAFINFRSSRQRLLFVNRFIPADQFEWISGLRKNFYQILVLLLLAIFLSPVKLFCLAALLLLNTIFLGFYTLHEPLLMLNPKFLSPEVFLNQKVNYLLKMIVIINTPLLLVNALFHPDSAWFSACFLIALILLGSCVVYIKYARYQPNLSQGFTIDQVILFGSLLFPYLLPLSLYLYYSNRKKAIAQLNYLQHDSHSDTLF